MDLYLEDEKLWNDFQHKLASCFYQSLLQLSDRYRASICQRTYSSEQALFTSIIREQHKEDFIEIRQKSDRKLITLIDIVSPTNKMRKEGRDSYLETRKAAQSCKASIVEIDLVLQGQPMLEYSRDGLPEWDYAITVERSTQPGRFEIYTTTMRKRLPRFKIPLASDDRDLVHDLQQTFGKCFDESNFGAKIDYKRDPALKLDDDDRKWIAEELKKNKLR
jgi:hypothetical protein